MLTDMMKGVITRGTGTLARFTNISMSEAGKTGTTSDDKDLVFVGYTPYYCAGIWMGYDNPKKIEYDKSYHLLLWKDIMEKIHQGLSDPGFTKPAGLTTSSICSVSGKSPSDLCSQDYYGNTIASDICAAEYVNNTGTCDMHKQFTVCSETGKLPGPNCKTMTVVLAVEGEEGSYEIKNAPSETPEGKVLINLNETCTEKHEPDISDIMSEEGGVISGNAENNGSSSSQPSENNGSSGNTEENTGGQTGENNESTPPPDTEPDNTTQDNESGEQTESSDTTLLPGIIDE